MRSLRRTLLLGVLLLTPGSLAQAQVAADPSGHWEGTLKVPQMELRVEIDLARDNQGVFAGTFSQPAQGVKGLPLSSVTVEASAVRFVVKGGPEPATFDGALSADATSISGTVTQSGFTIPMNLSRTGDARIVRVPKSAPIAKELEGTWNGTLDVNGATDAAGCENGQSAGRHGLRHGDQPGWQRRRNRDRHRSTGLQCHDRRSVRRRLLCRGP